MDLIESRSIFSPATGFIRRGGFDWTCNPYVGCTFGCSYCLAPGTLVLHANLAWRPIGQVAVGDTLVGFDESPPPTGKRLRREAVVESVRQSVQPTVRLITDRAEVVTTAGHGWLTARRGWWRSTAELRIGSCLKHLSVMPEPPETDDYRLGYLAGMTLGDGTFRYRLGQRSDKCGDPQPYWRVALKDIEPLARLCDYLGRLGISIEIRPFSAATGNRAAISKVETRALGPLARLHSILSHTPDTAEYERGFLGGFFDAEGSNGDNLRLHQKDRGVLERVVKYGARAGFRFELEEYHSHCYSVRLAGGRFAERMRFLSWVRPAIRRKVMTWAGWEAETETARVVAIEPGPAREVVDIQTSTRTFYAAGLASHNCYAAFLPQNRRPVSEWGRWLTAKSNAVELARRQAKKVARAAVYMSSVTDPYQPAERSLFLTRGILEALIPHQPRLVVQTRGPLVVRDTDLLREFRRVRVNVSIPTDSEDVRRAFEPKAPSLDRRWTAAEELKAAGVPVGLCVTPTLPLADPDAFAARLAAFAPAVLVCQDFHDSRGGFGADTGDAARTLLARTGWSPDAYRNFVDTLRKHYPTFEGEAGFFPPPAGVAESAPADEMNSLF